ncbi:MAG TPA: YMGG-like glycine zipper-containing protein [Candidatus Angelobacter sp.]|nr:YMGG-like glycine zipper-containing protein [Candidatus Angelobacter sp.]
MQAKWATSVCAVVLILGLGAVGQESGNSNDPILKTRPNDRNTPAPQQGPAAAYPGQGSPSSTYGAPPNAIPDGSRFIIKLKDTLDTKKMQDGKHFKAELREDLVTPSGLIIPKGRSIKGHVGRFEHGFTGSKMQLALDEIETRNGWVPLIGTVTGVPGDPSIKASGEEGEVYRKGPDKRKVITDAAIGATVGAVSGSVIGGKKGAAIGAAAGAGLGTGTSYLFKGGEMKLEKGTQLEVRLDRDLVVPTH